MSNKKKGGAPPPVATDVEVNVEPAIDAITIDKAVYFGTSSVNAAEHIVELAITKVNDHIYDQYLAGLQPGYVAETGVLLATEPSLIMYFSPDLHEFRIDNDMESAEPCAAPIDKACSDKTKVVVPPKPEVPIPTDDLESVITNTETDDKSLMGRASKPRRKMSKLSVR